MKNLGNKKCLVSKIVNMIDVETGEVIEKEVYIPAQNKSVDINWEKIWLFDVFSAMNLIGNKKVQVVTYLLANRDKNTNIISKTQREISVESGISLDTINKTIKVLESADFLVGKSGYYQINPDRIAYGTNTKRAKIRNNYANTKLNKKTFKNR